MIDKSMLEERKLKLLMDYNAIHGALQDIDYWISVIDAGEQSPADDVPLGLDD